MKYIIIVLVVILLALGGYFFATRLKSSGSDVAAPAGGGGVAPRAAIIPLDPSTIPAGEKISLGTAHGTVEVNNFYKISQGYSGDALIVRSTPQFQIIYNSETGAFAIYIVAGPVDAARGAAEKDLVNVLGVPEKDTCFLNVSWSVSPAVGSGLSGVARPLSFCLNNVQ